jgi:N-acetyl-gamma-glutamyl-phosphate reductase
MQEKIKVAVVGSSGYTGAELLRLLVHHPHFEVTSITAHSQAGRPVSEIHPHLGNLYPTLHTTTLDAALDSLQSCAVIFLALPHGKSMEAVDVLPGGPALVDLGGDFRLDDATTFERWYGFPHINPRALGTWQYGLTELYREKIRAARKIANPGCYPTAVGLAAAPLIKAGIVNASLVAACISGTSGAGKTLKESLHFSAQNDNIYAYRITNHQHTPEIEQNLSTLAAKPIKVSFVPHVAPLDRGIHATVACDLVSESISQADIDGVFFDFYRGSDFVKLVNNPPSTKTVRGSNFCHIHASLDQRTGRVVVTAVIDNLVKGAAGQAIQNANLLCGLKETDGLEQPSFYP